MVSEHERLAVWFEQLVDAHGAALERLATVYTTDRDAREDLLQEFLLAIWRALPSFRGECSERTFAYRVAHNRGLTYRARHRDDARLDDLPELPDPAPTPERQAERAIDRERLLGGIRRLPPALLQAMTLHLEGLSNAEAADVLGITENAVAVRLTRGRATLRALLSAEERPL